MVLGVYGAGSWPYIRAANPVHVAAREVVGDFIQCLATEMHSRNGIPPLLSVSRIQVFGRTYHHVPAKAAVGQVRWRDPMAAPFTLPNRFVYQFLL